MRQTPERYELRFRNRSEAGQLLAAQLAPYGGQESVVVGLTRGGVPVAYEIACHLETPLIALAVRKLGSPYQPELAIGALAPSGTTIFHTRLLQKLEIEPTALIEVMEREQQILEQREQQYAPYQPAVNLQDKTVILTDDGLATGMTMLAAAKYIRQRQPGRILIAVPVCASDTVVGLRRQELVETVICLHYPEQFLSVGLWYKDFEQVDDRKVIQLLQQANAFPLPSNNAA